MARTAKKKIQILDEGIVLVDDVDSIDFIGSGVSGTNIGNNVTENISGGGTGGGFTKLTTSGTVNSINTNFTFTEKPDYIISDGAWYQENFGWTWNAGTLTATMSIPPNNDIYGFT